MLQCTHEVNACLISDNNKKIWTLKTGIKNSFVIIINTLPNCFDVHFQMYSQCFFSSCLLYLIYEFLINVRIACFWIINDHDQQRCAESFKWTNVLQHLSEGVFSRRLYCHENTAARYFRHFKWHVSLLTFNHPT